MPGWEAALVTEETKKKIKKTRISPPNAGVSECLRRLALKPSCSGRVDKGVDADERGEVNLQCGDSSIAASIPVVTYGRGGGWEKGRGV